MAGVYYRYTQRLTGERIRDTTVSRDEHQSAIEEALGLLREGNPGAAEKIVAGIVDRDPGHFDAARLRGIACHLQGRNEEAGGFLRKAIAERPDSAETHHNLGVVLNALARYEEAAASFERAIEINPEDPEMHDALGSALVTLKRDKDAIASFGRAIEFKPDFPEAHNNLGTALNSLNRWTEAASCFQRAIKFNPKFAEAYINLGGVLINLNRNEDAAKVLRQGLGIQNTSAAAYNSLGVALINLKRFDEAVASFERAVEIDPDYHLAVSQCALGRRRICDWSSFSQTRKELTKSINGNRSSISPFVFLSFSGNPEDQLRCARLYAESKGYSVAHRVVLKASPDEERIRIAYLSADFREHATAYLAAELFERHDRERFEIFGISFGRNDKSPIRDRLSRSFDEFLDVRSIGDRAVAELIASRKIHIAVDLKGYTVEARTEIFCHRPAPIHVNYLGYPGTMGTELFDYIVVDPFVVPPDQQPFFSEQLVHLPECYQVNDTKRKIAGMTCTRKQAGLPKTGFVFCSFNATYKITPEIFDIWMRLLKGVPGSVLWLFEDNKYATRNLRKEAAARGIEPDRLVFAPRMKLADHLARHRLADLFLDTLPYNAHTTASDALWTGLPVLTCPGHGFAARVAGSLLRAIGLPEMVTGNLKEYEALALRLAANPDQLDKIRRKLTRNSDAIPLFDCARFCGHLESAYETMFDTWRAGKNPAPIKVPPAPI